MKKRNVIWLKISLLEALLSFLVVVPCVGQPPWQLNATLNGDGTGAALNRPTSIHVDKDNQRFYVTDFGNDRLLSYNKAGEIVHAFNAGGKLKHPIDMVKDENNTLYVLESGKKAITVIQLQKKTVVYKEIQDNGKTLYPRLLEINAGNLYVLDKAQGIIFSLDKKMSVLNRFSCSGCSAGFSDFIIEKNELFALSARERSVYKFDLNGTLKETISLGAKLGSPTSLTVSPSGLLFVLDRLTGKIFVHSRSGEFKYSFLGKGNNSQKLYYPIEIRFDPWGRLYAVDEGNGRVEVYSRL